MALLKKSSTVQPLANLESKFPDGVCLAYQIFRVKPWHGDKANQMDGAKYCDLWACT